MAQLEAREVPLHKVFCSDYDFRIPDYQRPYAWQTEQAQRPFVSAGGWTTFPAFPVPGGFRAVPRLR
ncbi:hypothetical protein [Streptomyces sp. NPDC058330]|uniref:hypothetical protein n=1 Tax=Streptomyces sp. NPDC058330 TaxID=3346449 RepID=UPI0036EF8AA9